MNLKCVKKNFDSKFYITYNKDLKNKISKNDAWKHFINFGFKKSKVYNLNFKDIRECFDPNYYKEKNQKNIPKLYLKSDELLWQHFIETGFINNFVFCERNKAKNINQPIIQNLDYNVNNETNTLNNETNTLNNQTNALNNENIERLKRHMNKVENLNKKYTDLNKNSHIKEPNVNKTKELLNEDIKTIDNAPIKTIDNAAKNFNKLLEDNTDFNFENNSLTKNKDTYPNNLYNCTHRYNLFDNNIEAEQLPYIYENITKIKDWIITHKKILFLCSDYPGYGGAATNCHDIQNFISNYCETYSVYWNYKNEKNIKLENKKNFKIVQFDDLSNILINISQEFIPDLIILKSAIHLNLKKIFNCKVVFFIPGIYKNTLNIHYTLLNKEQHDIHVNNDIISQIKYSDFSFSNSSHTADIIKKYYNIDVGIFYSGFINFYNKKIYNDDNFNHRKYEYGVIVSNFDRPIKNIETIINFLKNKKNVILIGKNSKKYKAYGFNYIEFLDRDVIDDYYTKIKYIVQDSFFESCSNVKIEALFNGCKIFHMPYVIISSTQYPGYGGAATNAYKLIKFYRENGIKTFGLFFYDMPVVNYDPENIGGIYLANNHQDKIATYNIKTYVYNYLKHKPTICLAKNYVAPVICKKIFNCYTIYLVSGMNYSKKNLEIFKNSNCSNILDFDFNYKDNILEIECNNISDLIVINSKLCMDIFKKKYPEYCFKIYKNYIDTTNILYENIEPININKKYDIILCCSNLTRLVKNNLFLIDILNDIKLKNYKKCIIGNSNEYFQGIPNTNLFGLLTQKECESYFQESKLLLFPSLFDANPNTVREALANNCLVLTTKNIGFYEILPNEFICNSYNKNEWIEKILFILKNYENLKNIEVNFKNCSEEIINMIYNK